MHRCPGPVEDGHVLAVYRGQAPRRAEGVAEATPHLRQLRDGHERAHRQQRQHRRERRVDLAAYGERPADREHGEAAEPREALEQRPLRGDLAVEPGPHRPVVAHQPLELGLALGFALEGRDLTESLQRVDHVRVQCAEVVPRT